ncbi:hypothetical protein K438DRAFT_1931331 [Mycena galopus ATCC 62051]|nr:hypothetical protein K438DRAFT_1931331 [Mycena galopus ATCC 62051]
MKRRGRAEGGGSFKNQNKTNQECREKTKTNMNMRTTDTDEHNESKKEENERQWRPAAKRSRTAGQTEMQIGHRKENRGQERENGSE